MKLLKKLLHKWFFRYEFDIILEDNAKHPYQKYEGDAGYDLFVNDSVALPPKCITNVPTGVFIKSTNVPAWLHLVGRSSTLIRHGLIVDGGVIDDGYTGELFVKMFNPTNETLHLYPDMRIGQFIIMPLIKGIFTEVERFKIKESDRGQQGFGSTGV